MLTCQDIVAGRTAWPAALLLAGELLAGGSAQGQPIEVAFSTSAAASLTGAPGLTVSDHDVVGSDRAGLYQQMLAAMSAALPPAVELDALDFVSPTEAYFSLAEDALLPGAIGNESFADEDVIAWNGAFFSLLWDGSAEGLAANVDVDALDVGSVVPLQLFLSFREPATLPAVGTVQDEDLVEFQQGLGFVALAFDGSAASVPAGADLDAVNLRQTDQWLLSFDVPGTIGALTFDDGDLVAWDPLSSVFDPTPWFAAASQGAPAYVDLVSVEATPGQVPVELLSFSIEPSQP